MRLNQRHGWNEVVNNLNERSEAEEAAPVVEETAPEPAPVVTVEPPLVVSPAPTPEAVAALYDEMAQMKAMIAALLAAQPAPTPAPEAAPAAEGV